RLLLDDKHELLGVALLEVKISVPKRFMKASAKSQRLAKGCRPGTIHAPHDCCTVQWNSVTAYPKIAFAVIQMRCVRMNMEKAITHSSYLEGTMQAITLTDADVARNPFPNCSLKRLGIGTNLGAGCAQSIRNSEPSIRDNKFHSSSE